MLPTRSALPILVPSGVPFQRESDGMGILPEAGCEQTAFPSQEDAELSTAVSENLDRIGRNRTEFSRIPTGALQQLLEEQLMENEKLRRKLKRLQEEKVIATEVFTETISKYEADISEMEVRSGVEELIGMMMHGARGTSLARWLLCSKQCQCCHSHSVVFKISIRFIPHIDSLIASRMISEYDQYVKKQTALSEAGGIHSQSELPTVTISISCASQRGNELSLT